ncbi:hypothetical protein [Zhihengliuella salsuginis]|uniref:DUF4190 domain-containing protein n=1 Tax=Zhihengliuella salsuginis TaxID=578222 RepID=A0ABQ3GC46_9MICC|nr:hypothetical protein [Zhihengliuella salsuginis]GHD00458.1 hypothetical protein GCM10008096_03790 [Zhihengliuella salsuginis]
MNDTTPDPEQNSPHAPRNPYGPSAPRPEQPHPDYTYPGPGQPVPGGSTWPPPGAPLPGPPRAAGLTIAALVLGIAAVCLALVPFVHFAAFPVALAAVVVAGIAMARKLHSRALAIAGLATGIAALLFAALWTLAFAAAFSAFEEFDDDFGAPDRWNGQGAPETYTFEAFAEVQAEVELYTGLDGDAYRTEEIEAGETFSVSVRADDHAGSITVTPDGGDEGVISCRILDSDGRVVSEDKTDASMLWAVCWPAEAEDHVDIHTDENRRLDA